jgi:hypothetical protein
VDLFSRFCLLLHILEGIFLRKSLCLFYSLTSGIRGRVRHIVFIHIVAVVATVGFCLRIILKGNRLNNLYYLQCSTVDVEAVSIAFQKRDYFDDTKSCSSSKSNNSLDLVDIQI